MTRETIEHMIKLHEGAIVLLRKELGAVTVTKKMCRVISKDATTKRFQWNDAMPDIGESCEVSSVHPGVVRVYRNDTDKATWAFVSTDVELYDKSETIEPDLTASFTVS